MNPVPAFDVEEYQTARLIYINDAKVQKRICPTNSTQYTSTIANTYPFRICHITICWEFMHK